MPLDLTGLRVFVASPGGLESERVAIGRTLQEFNEDRAHSSGVAFFQVGWERVTPGAERPQERINREVRASDYFVLMLWDRWGTSTSEDGSFTSGSHEEFSVALECLADPDAPIRDIVVFFKGIEASQLSKPDSQLQEVLQFKNGIEKSKELTYRMIDDSQELTRFLRRLLDEWTDSYETKQACQISDPMKLTFEEPEQIIELSEPDLLARAEQFEQDGLLTQAEMLFAHASVSHGIDAKVAFARFLRRTGRLAGALKVNDEILQQPALLVDDSMTALVLRAKVLTNMGVIQRKQGDLSGSEQRIREGLQTIEPVNPKDAADSRAYALDNLGLTLRRQGRNDEAAAAYGEALALRREMGDDFGAAKSLVHHSRLLKDRDSGKAIANAEEAVAIFELHPQRHEMANALVALGEALIEESDLDRAEQELTRALEINEGLGHVDGIAIASGQLSKAFLLQGDLENAGAMARKSLEMNKRSGNAEGIAIALRRLGSVRVEQGRVDEAIEYLEESLRLLIDQGNQHGQVETLGVLVALLDQTSSPDTEHYREHLADLLSRTGDC